MTDFGVPIVPVDDFVRVLLNRRRELHWLTGAGVSFSAGVPTAVDMIYDFKRTLYAQAKKIPVSQLDATDPDHRLRMDALLSDRPSLPAPGDPDEYAVLFELICPDPGDRQRYIEKMLSDHDPKPALGHLVLAAMWRLQILHVVWTTNFDPVMEDAAQEVAGMPRWLTVAALDNPTVAAKLFTDTDRPMLVKMHGDFQSERLNNTAVELRDADNALRHQLTEAMRTRGLVVAGYSGRDDSVMDALANALDAKTPYGAGVYWVSRPGSPLLPRVTEFLQAAISKGVKASIVECPSFEELMQGVRLLLPTDDKLDTLLNRFQPASRLSDFDRPPRGGRWPRIRLNAIAVPDYPKTARLIQCDIGGTKEVREAVKKHGSNLLVARRKDGVLAFGQDSDLLEAFNEFSPSLDYAPLDPFRSRGQESADLGLLYDAVVEALQRDAPLIAVRRHRQHLLVVDPAQTGHEVLAPLQRALRKQGLAGTIPRTRSRWMEGIELRLEHRYKSLWLVYGPTVWFEHAQTETDDAHNKEWARQRQVRRYNREYTALLKAWADVCCRQKSEVRLSALGIDNGTDALFALKRLAPFVERSA